MAFNLINHAFRKQLLKNYPLLANTARAMTRDPVRPRIGNREIVCFGFNGQPNYMDRVDYPFPAIRFKEATHEICALREKEKGDWKELSIEEKKMLYRYSFCQTFAEFKHITPEWKLVLGMLFYAIALALLFNYSCHLFTYGPMPESFSEESRRAQLKRMIALEVNPVLGLTSQWDYEKNDWKK